MLVKCKGIVIKTIAYSENSVIVKCYTDAYGLQSYMVNGVRSKKGSIKPSHLMPLNLLEMEVYHQQQKNLQRVKEIRCVPQLQSLHFDTIKSAIGMFTAEVLHKVIKEENQPDAALFSFAYNAIQWIDLQTEPVANFPIAFMVQLSKYLGFQPKGTYTNQTNGFDLQQGVFETYHLQHPYQLNPELSLKLYRFIADGFSNMQYNELSHIQRTQLLDAMMEYYQQHIDGLFDIQSHKVLATVLA
ncbi:MAG: DNA repair protein RecO [Bacteroidia bacterium]|jgi:DNA repair protein RecO (recombination protein O)|nr:DNA repair protein RecO [Bacteroidia bacterium]